MDQLLTKADAAKLLGTTPAAVVAMHRRGALHATRTTGGVRLFSLREVQALAAARATTAPPSSAAAGDPAR